MDSGVVEFLLKLKDLTGAGLKSFGKNSDEVFKKTGRSVNDLEKQLRDLEKSRRLIVDVNGLKEANREVANLKREINGLNNLGVSAGKSGGGGGLGFGGMFGANLLANMAVRAGTEIAHGISGVISSTLQTGIGIQNQIIGMSTFIGEKKANEVYERLMKQAVLTPFTSQQLLGMERGLMPYMSPDKANAHTMALANAVAATGGSNYTLERMSWHMSQMAASGKMEGMQAREFGFAGIPIWKLLADAFFPKMEVKKAQDKLKDMTITYDMVATALERANKAGGMFADGMKKLSQTVGGKWSSIQDLWQNAQWAIFKSASPAIVRLEDRIMEMLQKLPAWAQSVAPEVSKAIDDFINWMPNLKGFGESLMSIAGKTWKFITSKEAADLATGMVHLAETVTKLLVPAFDALYGAITMITDLFPKAKGTSNLKNGADEVWYGKAPTKEEWAAQFHKDDYKKNMYAKPSDLFLDNKIPAPFRFGVMGTTAADASGGSYTPNGGIPGVGALDDAGGKITGGGRKQVIININREIFQFHDTKIQTSAGGMMGMEQIKRMFEEWLLGVMKSAGAAL